MFNPHEVGMWNERDGNGDYTGELIVSAEDYGKLLALYLEHKNTAVDVHWLAAQLESRLNSDSARIRKENAGVK